MPELLDQLKFKQPQKCKGCYWGSWNGTKQFCSRMQCVKGQAQPDGGGLELSAVKQA